MGRTADMTVAEVWRERLRRQRRSGLSISEFCREEAVSPASFYRWRKRLKDWEDGTGHPPLFVPVQVATGQRPGVGVEIELPGGAVIRLPSRPVMRPRLLPPSGRSVTIELSVQLKPYPCFFASAMKAGSDVYTHRKRVA